MSQELQVGQPDASQPADGKLNVGRWLGRHEALDMIARGCSGVDAACLKRVREEKLYQAVAPNWDQFCKKELHTTRKRIDAVIRRFEEFGPAYFDLSRLTRVTADEYRQIAPAVGAEGVRIGGETVAIAPENKDKLDAALAAVRKKRAKPSPDKRTFHAVMGACETAVAIIERAECWPDLPQKLELADVLVRMRLAAARLGVLTA